MVGAALLFALMSVMVKLLSHGLPNAMVSNKSQTVDAAWLKRFADAAKAGGWKTNMVWYRVVDDQPG